MTEKIKDVYSFIAKMRASLAGLDEVIQAGVERTAQLAATIEDNQIRQEIIISQDQTTKELLLVLEEMDYAIYECEQLTFDLEEKKESDND